MVTFSDIDKAAADYSETHNALREQIEQTEMELARVRKLRIRVIRALAEKAAEKKARLRGMIDGSRELFERPRTRILHGVKIGIVKGKGEIVIDNPERTVELIYKRLPELHEELLIIKQTPSKTALAALSAEDLKRIGVRVEETGDQIVVKPTASEIDKLVDALLSENDEPEAA